MACITLSSPGPGPLVVNVHFTTSTVRDVELVDRGDGIVEIELADTDIGVRLVGPVAVLHAIVIEADRQLTALRDGRPLW